MAKSKNIDTKVIHSGELIPRIFGAVTMPIFQSSTYEYESQINYHSIKYLRLNNTPNHEVLNKKIAALENGESALVSGSGMAAISSTLLAFLKSGDHLLTQSCLYGGTHGLLTQDLSHLGISFDFIDGNEPDSWKEKIKPSTKIIYVESISNPTLDVPNLEAIVQFAKANQLISIIDNTFASPVNFRPLEIGFDLAIHSCTKYLNGHSDIVAGAVIGKEKHIEAITHKLNHFGGALDAHACFLLHRGIKTLAIRVRHQNQSALKIAKFLQGHPGILNVNYPGLETNPQFSRTKKMFDGFGGMLAFRVKGGAEAAIRLIEKVKIPAHAPSLGGVESLITRPWNTIHANMSSDERVRMGITDDLIRLSVGLESVDDLIEDFSQALQ